MGLISWWSTFILLLPWGFTCKTSKHSAIGNHPCILSWCLHCYRQCCLLQTVSTATKERCSLEDTHRHLSWHGGLLLLTGGELSAQTTLWLSWYKVMHVMDKAVSSFVVLYQTGWRAESQWVNGGHKFALNWNGGGLLLQHNLAYTDWSIHLTAVCYFNI